MPFKPIHFLWFVGWLFLLPGLQAQEATFLPRELKDLVESASFENDDNQDYQNIMEDLLYFRSHPLNLNTADAENLGRLHLLTPFQIHSLIGYRKQYGHILSVYELPLIYGFNTQLAQTLAPFVTTEPARADDTGPLPGPLAMIRDSRKQLMIRAGSVLERQQGYRPPPDTLLQTDPNSYFRGNSLRYYTRLSLRYRNFLRLGATLEKDPGETFFRDDNRHGFDFNSFHLYLSDSRWLDKLAVGDYDIRYGQGLVAWSGLSLSKSSMVLNHVRGRARIDPYTSANENDYFRGVAMERSFDPLSLTLFYSDKYLDANIVDTLESGLSVFSSFQQTGYHRLPRELADERSIREQVFGGNICYNRSRLKISLNGISYRYGGMYRPPSRPENQYRFTGQGNTNLSLDYQVAWNRFYFFGEEAFSVGEGRAFLNGVTGQLTPGVAMMLLHRHYQRDYQSMYGSAFSEGARAQNESGLYLGMEAEVGKGLMFRGYVDSWRFPWISYWSSAPAHGWDALAEADYSPRDQMNMYFRYQHESRTGDFLNGEDAGTEMEQERRRKVRFHLRYQLSRQFTADNRIEFVSVHSGGQSRGLMLYQDIRYQPSRFPIRIDLRYAFFDTDDYQSRIYAYEDDLLYVFSVPPYYLKGYRTYLNMKYTRGPFDFWFKLARTGYIDLPSVGSGLARIEGSNKTTLYFQMRVRF